jgi:uncharacterized protein YndB with AHSA1/START domain
MATATEALSLNEGLDQGMKVQVSNIIRASRARVFAAWTNPELIKTWFGPPNRVTTGVRVDLRIGGEYCIEMTNEDLDPRVATASGIYTEIVPDERLRFTWLASWAVGEETLLTVSLKDVPSGTEVTLLHEHFSSIVSMNNHEKGWTGALAKLSTVLEA